MRGCAPMRSRLDGRRHETVGGRSYARRASHHGARGNALAVERSYLVGAAGPPLRFAFADESFRDPQQAEGQLGYYQLAAVLLDGFDVSEFRINVRSPSDAAGEFKASARANAGDRRAIADMLDMIRSPWTVARQLSATIRGKKTRGICLPAGA